MFIYDISSLLSGLPNNLLIAMLIFLAIRFRKGWIKRNIPFQIAFSFAFWAYLVLGYFPWMVMWYSSWFEPFFQMPDASWLSATPAEFKMWIASNADIFQYKTRGFMILSIQHFNPFGLNPYTIKWILSAGNWEATILIGPLTALISIAYSSIKANQFAFYALMCLIVLFAFGIGYLMPNLFFLFLFCTLIILISDHLLKRIPNIKQISQGLTAGLVVGGMAHLVALVTVYGYREETYLSNSIVVVAIIVLEFLISHYFSTIKSRGKQVG